MAIKKPSQFYNLLDYMLDYPPDYLLVVSWTIHRIFCSTIHRIICSTIHQIICWTIGQLSSVLSAGLSAALSAGFLCWWRWAKIIHKSLDGFLLACWSLEMVKKMRDINHWGNNDSSIRWFWWKGSCKIVTPILRWNATTTELVVFQRALHVNGH